MKLICAILIVATLTFPAFGMAKGELFKAMRDGYKPEMKLKEGDSIIDFEIKDICGNLIKTAELRKGKILLIRFMTLNAGLKGEQITILNNLQDQYRDDLQILDILDKEAKPEDLIEFYERSGAAFLPAIDTENKIFEQYAIERPPAVLVIDKTGKIFFAAIRVHHDDLNKALERALRVEQPAEPKVEAK